MSVPRKKIRSAVLAWIDRREVSDSAVTFATAILVGVGAGFGAVAFRWFLGAVRWIGYGAWTATMPDWGQTSRRTGSGRPRSRAAGVLLRPRSEGPRRSRGHGGRSPTWRANPASGGAGQGARVGRLHRHRGLGALAGGLAVGFSRGLYLMEDVWDRLRAWEWAKPAFGGLVLGSLGILSFQVDGLSTVLSSDSISLRRGNEQHVVRGTPCYATATSSPLSGARIRCPTLEDCSSAESPRLVSQAAFGDGYTRNLSSSPSTQ